MIRVCALATTTGTNWGGPTARPDHTLRPPTLGCCVLVLAQWRRYYEVCLAHDAGAGAGAGGGSLAAFGAPRGLSLVQRHATNRAPTVPAGASGTVVGGRPHGVGSVASPPSVSLREPDECTADERGEDGAAEDDLRARQQGAVARWRGRYAGGAGMGSRARGGSGWAGHARSCGAPGSLQRRRRPRVRR